MPQVLILTATRNGDRFLEDLLASIALQSHRGWRLLISDNTSPDHSRKIVRDFIRTRPEGQAVLLQGPSKGATENSRSLLRQAELSGQLLAFSGQDYAWERDHLSRALGTLRLPDSLAVYGCRMKICAATLKLTGLSNQALRPLSFRNALVQNMLSGNTMVMTPAAADSCKGANGRKARYPFPIGGPIR